VVKKKGRRKNGTFEKGVSGNPSGKPKDVQEIIRLAREKCPEAIEKIYKIMMNSKASHSAQIQAAKEILDRGLGKAVQPTKEVDDETYAEFLKALKGDG